MKKIVVSALLSALLGGLAHAGAANVSFVGNSLKVLEVTPEKDTGLDMIFVAYDLTGVSIKFSDASLGQSPKWYKYNNLGGGYAEELTDITVERGSMTLNAPEGDMGYIIEYGDSRRYYFWLTNYSDHRLSLKGVKPADEQSCDNTMLELDFTGDPIRFFTITGQTRYLDQQITVAYTNLEWNEDDMAYDAVDAVYNIEYPKSEITIYPPVLAQTFFTVNGDRFLKQWNWEQSVESALFRPNAVDAHTEAVQEGKDEEPEDDAPGSNIIHGGEGALGGSAPADISFKAYVTEGVMHNEWQLTRDPSFNDIDYRFNVQDLDYTFNEEGNFYVRYIGSNSDGTCEVTGETYIVNIGASEIKCPNAFSPGVSPGVNDEWKVSYRSIISFKCWIFNRYGTQMCYLDNPNDGWDGKYHGKYVKPGVYYYVIEAEGADGKKYKLSGDINILGYRQKASQGGGSEDPGEAVE